MRFGRSPLASLCCSLLAIPAPAQDGVRWPSFARVEDAAGNGLAGAIVTFAGHVPHLGSEVVPEDVLVVQADARGRAQAKLLPGLCYVAWAVGPAAADGQVATAPVQGWFGAGALLTLRLGPPQPSRSIVVRGAEAWQAQGPLQFWALVGAPGPELELTPVGDRLSLPAGPLQAIEVRDRDGRPLWHVAGDSQELVVPPPRRLVVRAVDEADAPLAGAVVRHRVGRLTPWRLDNFSGVVEVRWRELGTTGADGRCEVVVPYAADPLQEATHGDLLLFAGAAGRPSVASGVFNRALYQSDHKVPVGTKVGDELRFVLRPQAPLQGNVGAVAPGSFVHLSAVCKLYVERTSYLHDARSFLAPVAADGTFAFADLPAELHSCRLTLVPPRGQPATMPMFQSMTGRELPPLVAAADGPGQLGEVIVDLSLQVTDPGGGPARGNIAFLVPAEQRGVLLRDSVVRVPLDTRGAVTLRLAPGRWLVMAASEAGYGVQSIELAAGQRELKLAMQPLSQLRVELRDDQGRPIAGATVQSRGTTTRGSNDLQQSLLQGLRSQQQRTSWVGLRTDADGRLSIPFVPIDGVAQRLELSWPGGTSGEFVLEPADDWLALRPR